MRALESTDQSIMDFMQSHNFEFKEFTENYKPFLCEVLTLLLVPSNGPVDKPLKSK